MIHIKILGGVGEYGRNCFLLEHEATNTRIMLDCGVLNGNPEKYPPITEEIASSVQAVFISHVHNDHVGALPLLAARGFSGDVWMSEASQQQMAAISHSWLKHKPFHFRRSSLCFRSFQNSTKGERIFLSKDLSFIWGYSGHMLGSVWYVFYIGEETVFYSGDLVLNSPLLITDLPPSIPFDLALLDTGHCMDSAPYDQSIENILAAINSDPHEAYGIPVNISGKACDLIYHIHTSLTDRDIFIEDTLHEHLMTYLHYQENLQQGKEKDIFSLLKDSKLKILAEWDFRKPGVYFFTRSKKGLKTIHTNDHTEYPSFFYKSHPDLQDVACLLKQVHAENYIFFHSKQPVLEHLLHCKVLKKSGT